MALPYRSPLASAIRERRPVAGAFARQSRSSIEASGECERR
jgi:hypothetical protein